MVNGAGKPLLPRRSDNGGACALGLTGAALLLPGRWYLLAWLPFAAGAWLVLRLPRRTALVLILLGAAAPPPRRRRQPPDQQRRRVPLPLGRPRPTGRHRPVPLSAGRPATAPASRRRPLALDRRPWCTDPTAARSSTAPTYRPSTRPSPRRSSPPSPPCRPRAPVPARCSGPPRPPRSSSRLLIVYLLSTLGRIPAGRVLWAWCPLVALETGNNAHIDVVAVLLAAVALGLLARPVPAPSVLGGAVLGLAIATKLTPGLLLPAVVRRRPIAVALGVLGAIGTVYLPHLLAVGPAVLGYLPGYLHEEGFTNGDRYALLGWVLPHALGWSSRPPCSSWPPWRSGSCSPATRTARGSAPASMVAAALLVTTPNYPWYALLLVMLVALRRAGRIARPRRRRLRRPARDRPRPARQRGRPARLLHSARGRRGRIRPTHAPASRPYNAGPDAGDGCPRTRQRHRRGIVSDAGRRRASGPRLSVLAPDGSYGTGAEPLRAKKQRTFRQSMRSGLRAELNQRP